MNRGYFVDWSSRGLMRTTYCRTLEALTRLLKMIDDKHKLDNSFDIIRIDRENLI